MGENAEKDAKRAGAKWVKPVALLGAVIVILVLSWALGIGNRILSLREWIKSLGSWGPLVFILLYAVATVAALPGFVLTVMAGALFGLVKGTIIVSIASTLGASLAFLVGRYFARSSIEQWLGGSDRFRRLDDMTARQGHVIVAITRLVPLFPFNFLNYAFGLTSVSFWTYVFWSWLCMLPATVLYVAGTDAVMTAIAEKRVPWAAVAAALAIIVILTLVVRKAKNALAGEPAEANSSDDEAPPVEVSEE